MLFFSSWQPFVPVPALFTLFALALWFLPTYLKMGTTTIPQLMEARFGRGTKLMFSFVIVVMYSILNLPVILYSGAVVFENIFDISGIFGISKFQAVAILCVVIGIIGGCYAIFGGLKAVAVSDTIHGIGLIIGGLMIHGLQPGPLLYSQHPELVGGIMAAYFMANVVMYVMELGLMKAFVRMVNVKLSYLFPAIVACCVLGVYTLNNRMFDVWVMIIFGFVGYLLICLGIDMAPVILGFILGPLIEKYMRMALISANGNWGDIMARPVAVFFVIIAVLFVVVPMIRKATKATKKAQ